MQCRLEFMLPWQLVCQLNVPQGHGLVWATYEGAFGVELMLAQAAIPGQVAAGMVDLQASSHNYLSTARKLCTTGNPRVAGPEQ